MMVADCPRNGRTLIDFADLLSLVNVEPGVIVMHWLCSCGDEHVRATGGAVSADPGKAESAERAVKTRICAHAGDMNRGVQSSEREAV